MSPLTEKEVEPVADDLVERLGAASSRLKSITDAPSVIYAVPGAADRLAVLRDDILMAQYRLSEAATRLEAAEAEVATMRELTPTELQLLMHLRNDQQSNVHSVVESDREKWDLGFALSNRGMLAIVSHPRGGTFHITRLGQSAIDAALSGASS